MEHESIDTCRLDGWMCIVMNVQQEKQNYESTTGVLPDRWMINQLENEWM